MTRNTHAAMSVLLCLQLLVPGAAAAETCEKAKSKKEQACKEAVTVAESCKDAKNGQDCKTLSGPVTLEIGQPSVWSLAQAHYLLTKMHQTNRSLDTKMPGIDQLDANRANASRLDILRTLLQVDAGFDQSVGLKNQVELQHFREKEERKAQAQIQLQQRQFALQQLDQELLGLNQQIAVLTVQDGLSDKARGSAPPSDADRQRKEQIASLTAQREAKETQRNALQTEITTLTTTATGDIATPSVSVGAPPTSTPAPGSTFTSPVTAGGADSTALKDFASQAIKSFASSPSLAASAALDNFVGMQYEIIAKQLTLLRDEAGPDERIVFFELPTSIYTVDRWADSLIAQVEWKVTKIYDQKPKAEIACRSLDGQDSPIALFKQLRTLPGAEKSPCLDKLRQQAVFSALKDTEQPTDEITIGESDTDKLLALLRQRKATQAIKILGLDDKRELSFKYPITLDMIREAYDKGDDDQATELDPSRARALEIIPRQSALNINEYQATTNNTGFLGLLKLLSGFGAQINFQRQKELYQDFLQQDVYASGFGKGTASFGWTFGPLPGSRRLAPGQRTTYAVLSVPRKALAVRVTADAWAFPGRVQPERRDLVRHRSFLVRIPSEDTERFWVKSAVYAPVQKGKTTTVLLEGNGFSPQLGVLVNGVSLKRVLSISRAESDEPEINFRDSGVQGEFELTNSRDMVLRFSMGGDFTGTPFITLVTPERTTNINEFPMQINFRSSSLRAAALREPMFTDRFSVESKLEKVNVQEVNRCLELEGEEQCTQTVAAIYRLSGTGLRPQAEISVAEVALEAADIKGFAEKCSKGNPVATQVDSRSYLLCFSEPTTPHWKVRYRQSTTQDFEMAHFEHLASVTEFEHQVRNYRFEHATRHPKAEIHLSFSIPVDINDLISPIVCFENSKVDYCGTPEKDQDGKYRVRCTLDGSKGERDFITVRTVAVLKEREAKLSCDSPQRPGDQNTQTWFVDLRLPVRPRLVSINSSKSLVSSKLLQAVLTGVNLQRVTGVLIGDKAAVLRTPPEPERLLIQVPPHEVPAGQKEQVPVIFQTDEGAIPTGFSFEYSGPPLPQPAKGAKTED